MRVTISSSSNDLIDNKYKETAIKITTFLAENKCDLNWGSGPNSIMGICYDIFASHNRNIYGYTTPKYIEEIKKLPKAKHTIFDTTFDLKKHLFEDADVIVLLPGGTGTISEFFSYLEEIRSNDKNIPLIIYNEDNHFNTTLALINDLISRYFNNQEIHNFIKIANDFEEFKYIYNEIITDKSNK